MKNLFAAFDKCWHKGLLAKLKQVKLKIYVTLFLSLTFQLVCNVQLRMTKKVNFIYKPEFCDVPNLSTKIWTTSSFECHVHFKDLRMVKTINSYKWGLYLIIRRSFSSSCIFLVFFYIIGTSRVTTEEQHDQEGALLPYYLHV